jgi:hypothetical protein
MYVGKLETCKDGIRMKIVEHFVSCTLEMHFLNGKNPDEVRTASGRTVRQHEQAHIDHAEAYIEIVDATIHGYLDECFCPKCAEAIMTYLSAAKLYYEAKMIRDDAAIDCSDWPQNWRKTSEKCSEYNSANSTVFTLGQKLINAINAMHEACDETF